MRVCSVYPLPSHVRISYVRIQSAITNASKKDKKKPKANFAMLQTAGDDAPEDEDNGTANGGPSEAVAVTADDLEDDDFGPSKKSGKKGKKEKKDLVQEAVGNDGEQCGAVLV